MKLIENISTDNTVLSYFPGVDQPNKFTSQNPAVFHKVYQKNDEYSYVNIPKFINISEQPKYLFVKLDAQINYQIFIEQSNGSNYSFQIIAFDYLSCLLQDINNDTNYFFDQNVGMIYQNYNYKEKRINLCLEKPLLLLLKIKILNNNSTNSIIKLCFSNPPIEFDYSAHWVRNWQNKINGNSWDFTGKINNLLDLKSLNRNKNIFYNINEYWKNGVEAYAVPCNEKLNSFENMKSYFNDISEELYQDIENIKIENSFLGFDSQFIAHMKFNYYNPVDQNNSFYIRSNGEFSIKINDSIYYGQNNQDIYLRLEQGYHQIQIYFNYYHDSESPNFNIAQMNSSNTILKNEYDINKYISLNDVFEDVINRSIYDGYINMGNSNSFNIRCKNIIDKYCTISFWLRIKSIPENKEIDIINCNTLSIKTNIDQNNKTILKIKHIIDQNPFNIELNNNEWYHICIVMSQAFISCYINFSENYCHKINFSASYDSIYKIGHDDEFTDTLTTTSYDLYNILIFNQAKKQIQVNKLYLNQKI